jgi:DNA repair protein RecO (recombination protein O)
MANYKAQAINLKSYNLGESDKIMVMYSREHGLIRCVAKGAKKASSSLGGRMQLLVANNLLLAKGRNLDIVCQAEIIDSFSSIRNDMTKLIYSFYCAELITNFGLENDTNCKNIYDISFEALKNISIFSSLEEILWTVIRFKLRLMEAVGYAIELNQCVKCNETEHDFSGYHFFCPESGGVICSKCDKNTTKTLEIDKRHLNVFRDTQIYDFPEDEGYFDRALLYSCFNIMKEYVSVRSDKKLKTPEMIETLCC